MPTALKSTITDLVSGIEPADNLAQDHRERTLSWLAGTDDIFRRVKPRTPSPHLVSYFLLVDREAGSVLLCGHRLSGLWLPTGGHVELDRTGRTGFEPHLLRALAALGLTP